MRSRVGELFIAFALHPYGILDKACAEGELVDMRAAKV